MTTDRRKIRNEWETHLATLPEDVQAQALRDDLFLSQRQSEHHCWKGLCLAPAVVSLDAGGEERMGLCDFHGHRFLTADRFKGHELRDYEWSEEVRAATHRLIAQDLTPWWEGDGCEGIDLIDPPRALKGEPDAAST